VAERISIPTEQRVILKDGRTLGFAEYGDPKGEPAIEFHGCPGSRLEAWNYDEAGKKLGARVIGVDRPGFGISTYVKGYRIVDWPADVIELANALGLKRFAVAGISSGSPYALACARFIPERLKGCAVVSGLPPLTVKGEKLDPSHYLMAEELLMARLAKTVPFAARAIFRHVLWQLRKDPANAMKQLKGVTAGDIELLKHPETKRAFQQIIAEGSRGGVRGSVESLALEMRDWGFFTAGHHIACQHLARRGRLHGVSCGCQVYGLEAAEPRFAHDSGQRPSSSHIRACGGGPARVAGPDRHGLPLSWTYG
jgi:pimeloyl-ACP methyl ester carboxylesterase